MRKLFSTNLFFAVVVFMVAATAWAGGLVGEKYPAFERLFHDRHILSGQSRGPGESCITFVKDDWKGIACFRDGVCAVFLLFPDDDYGCEEGKIVRQLDAWNPGLVWTRKGGRKLCQDDICHGGLFPRGRGAYLILGDAQKQARSRKAMEKDIFTQSMTTAILRLGDPTDYEESMLVWETSQMRIGIPVVSSSMGCILWTPTRQKKLSDKKALRVTKALTSVEFTPPSYEDSGGLIGYGEDEEYCFLKEKEAPYMYRVCTSKLRYRDLKSMTRSLVYPRSVNRSSVSSTSSNRKPDSATSGTSVPGSTPAGQQPAVNTEPAPVTEKPPTHEELLKLFIDSLEKSA